MQNLFLTVLFIAFCAMGSAAKAYCKKLCDVNWWQNASDAQIIVALSRENISTVDSNGNTPLMFASALRDGPVIRAVIEAGADPNAKNIFQKSALHWAIDYANYEALLSLRSSGADFSVKLLYGENEINLLAYALKKVGTIDLGKANKENKRAIIEHLVDAGVPLPPSIVFSQEVWLLEKIPFELDADFEIFNLDGETSLTFHSSGRPEQGVRALEKLISLGLDINGANKESQSPLMKAVKNSSDSRLSIASFLMDSGATVSQVDSEGMTALMHLAVNVYAREDSIRSTALKLLKNGANLDARDFQGKSALMHSVKENNIKLFGALIEVGANPDFRDFKGKTALMMACENGHLDMVKQLITSGSNINAIDKNGDTALLQAVSGGKPDLIATLINAGAELNHANKNGNTAIMKVAGFYSPEIVEILLEAGAEVSNINAKGQNALDIARSNPKLNNTPAFWKINDALFK